MGESRVCSGNNCVSHLAGEAQHIAYIMDTPQTIIQLFFGTCQVVYVGSAVIATGIAVAALLDGAAFGPVACGFNIDTPLPGKHAAITCYTRWQRPVAHIHTQANT